RPMSTGLKEDVCSLDEGEAIFQWPENLSAESASDLDESLKFIGKKIKRAAGKAQRPDDQSADEEEGRSDAVGGLFDARYNTPMKHCKLRIAWSWTWGTALLVIAGFHPMPGDPEALVRFYGKYYWHGLVVLLLVTAASWLPTSFSLRDLLITTTLVAI